MLRRAGGANFECCMGESISRPEGAGVGRAMGLGVWSEDELVLTGDFFGESAMIRVSLAKRELASREVTKIR